MKTHTEKQFLFNCGEHNWTDTWWDIFPEEVIQLIYRFVNADNIEFNIPYVYIYYRGRERWQNKITYNLMKKYENKGWLNAFGVWIQKDIVDTGFEIRYPQTLHDLKMLVAKLAGQRYSDSEVECYIERGGALVWVGGEYPRYINYDGFKFKLYKISYINDKCSTTGEKIFNFCIEYDNDNLGRIQFFSNNFDRSLTTKKSKRFIKYPDDFQVPRLVIIEKNIPYYNAFKQD